MPAPYSEEVLAAIVLVAAGLEQSKTTEPAYTPFQTISGTAPDASAVNTDASVVNRNASVLTTNASVLSTDR